VILKEATFPVGDARKEGRELVLSVFSKLPREA